MTNTRLSLFAALLLLGACTTTEEPVQQDDPLIAWANIEYWDGALEIDASWNVDQIEEVVAGEVRVHLDDWPENPDDMLILCTAEGLANAPVCSCSWNSADEIRCWLYDAVTAEFIRTGFSFVVLDGSVD